MLLFQYYYTACRVVPNFNEIDTRGWNLQFVVAGAYYAIKLATHGIVQSHLTAGMRLDGDNMAFDCYCGAVVDHTGNASSVVGSHIGTYHAIVAILGSLFCAGCEQYDNLVV